MLMIYYTKKTFSSISIFTPLHSLSLSKQQLPVIPSISNVDIERSILNTKAKSIASIKASSKIFTSTIHLIRYPFIHKDNPIKVKFYQITMNRSLWYYGSLSFFALLSWYFLYYRKRKLSKSFIDYIINNILCKIITNNKAVTSIISNLLYSKAISPSTQQAFNVFIKEGILANKETMSKIQLSIKERLISYLKSDNVVKDVQTLFNKSIIQNPSNKKAICDFLYNTLINNNSEYITRLIEMKCIELLNNEEFIQYVYREVASETELTLRDNNTINYTIQHINS